MVKRNLKGKFVKESVLSKYEKVKAKRQYDRRDHIYCTQKPSTIGNDVDQGSTYADLELGKDMFICTGEDFSWKNGRRVVDLGYLAEGLSSCASCNNPLSLHCCINEKRYGLGSYLDVRCHNKSCCHVNRISTGTQHYASEMNIGVPTFDVNMKTTLGT